MTDPIRASEALAVRSLLEEVARMGDCIGRHTVGKIMEISDRAATWLAENPPGQIARARAALAAVPDGPAVPESREPASVTGESTDEELLELMPETMRDEFSYAAKACSNATGGQVKPGIFRVCLNSAALEYARAVLAHWGNHSPGATKMVSPAPVLAEGEVAELVEWLRENAEDERQMCESSNRASRNLERAAELLQQQQAKIESLEQQLETERMRVVACGIIATSDTPFSAAKNRNCHPDYWSASADDIARQIDELMRLRAQQTPVPVSERLPGPEDCALWPDEPEATPWCWAGKDIDGGWEWAQISMLGLGIDTLSRIIAGGGWTHWLPAHALPLPQAREVQP